MVVAPEGCESGINCEGELREFSGVMELFCNLMEA